MEKIYAYSSMAPAVDETAIFIAAMIIFLEALLLGWVFRAQTQKLSFSELLLVGMPFELALILVVSSNSLASLIWGAEGVYLATVWVIISRCQPDSRLVERAIPILAALILGAIIYVAWDEKLRAITLSVSLMTAYLLLLRLSYWRVRNCLLTQIGSR